MQYQVPQFIEVEDKIFGPLTFKQFLYIYNLTKKPAIYQINYEKHDVNRHPQDGDDGSPGTGNSS